MKPLMQPKAVLWLLAGLCVALGCEQYDPSQSWKLFKNERRVANQPLLNLTTDGTLPEKSEGDQNLSTEEQQYASFCAACHGTNGSANTPSILAMNPVPRNLTDPTWQKTVGDDHIAKVIKQGGAAVGLNATMPPWGAVLSDQDIDLLVALIRSWNTDSP